MKQSFIDRSLSQLVEALASLIQLSLRLGRFHFGYFFLAIYAKNNVGLTYVSIACLVKKSFRKLLY